ncbi:hypothetical protein [Thalassolituus sp.]|jgi:hypothetical protein|uniref:hypothetical protein n=1 Tax=Thalassolituus sp. TaxID=2030822 RepID=UPI0027D5B9BE|nr:hypothetical protein [Thalassolituus sp.]MDQ4424954.1 hypothetical protein [Thalassolituus sp.]
MPLQKHNSHSCLIPCWLMTVTISIECEPLSLVLSQANRRIHNSVVFMSTLLSFTRQSLGPVVTAFLGGYLFTWGFVALTVTSTVTLGWGFHTAEHTAFLLAFPVFLLVFFWLFLSRKTLLTHAVAYGGGVLMTAASVWLQSMLLAQGA